MSVDAATQLQAADALLFEHSVPRTLAPDRSRATLPSELAAELLQPGDPADVQQAFAAGLRAVVVAVIEAFPDNLFWDLDHLVATVLSAGRREPNPAAAIESRFASIAELQHRFGQASSIRFRYIHDFIYGFDWARWVAKDPAARASVGPFDAAFVERMHRRGRELAETIARGDDEKYPPLPRGTDRNPFRFQREPDVELELHRLLARQRKLPVQAWQVHAVPRYDAPFTQLREVAAAALG